MEQILQHIADEQEIKDFHAWISQLCHPDSPVANVQHFDQIQSDHQAKLESLRANRKDNLSLTNLVRTSWTTNLMTFQVQWKVWN